MKSIYAALFATALVAPAAFADSANEMVINSVTGSGSACKTDASGRPIDFSVINTTQGGKKVFRVGFDNFSIATDDFRGESASKDCTLLVNVSYPAGKTIHTFNSFVEGSGDVSRGDRATVRTSVSLPGGRPSSKRYSITATGDSRWKSPMLRSRSTMNAPCGGKNVTVRLSIDLSLRGKDSLVSIGGSSSQFADIDYQLKDCE